MSSEIFYDKAFIQIGEKYIPVVNHGSSNCFDFDRRGREIPEKHWSTLNYPFHDKLLFTAEELREIATKHEEASMSNRGGTRKSRNRSFEEGEFERWILAGMKTAQTVEDYSKYGNTAVVLDCSDSIWQRHPVHTTEELLEKIKELSGRRITVSFLDNRHLTHPPVRRKGKAYDFSQVPEYYVLRTGQGFFSKRSSRHVWFVRSNLPSHAAVRKFKTDKAARDYLEKNHTIFSKYAFEVECVQNGGTGI